MLSNKRSLPVRALLAVAALTFVYCSDSDEPTEPVDPLAGAALCLSDSSCTMGAVCDTSSAIDVSNCGNSTSLSWTAQSNATWLGLSVSGGDTPAQLCLIADSNRTGALRSATVTVTADNLTDESIDIDVSQQALGSTLSVSVTEWEAYCLGDESEAISVTNPGNDVAIDWVVTESEDWLELSVAEGGTPGSFTISVDTNNTGAHRTGTVTVTAEGVPGSPWEVTVHQPAIIAFSGVYNTPGTATNVFTSGNYAYVADWSNGLQIIDVSDPAGPTLAGSAATLSPAVDVYAQDDFAYLAAGCDVGLRIFDVSDPTDPSGILRVADCVVCVYVRGDYAFIVDGESDLFYIIDVSNLAEPSVAGGCMILGGVSDIFVSGDYAYLAGAPNGLQVIDVSDPSFPDVVGNCKWSGYALRVSVTGDYAYVSDAYGGFEIIDVSDPTDPYAAEHVYWSAKTNGVCTWGDYVLMAAVDGAVAVFDITDPTAPVLVGNTTWGDDLQSVFVSNGCAYVAAGGHGLVVMEIGL
jgi:hypothetical protein